VSGLVGVEASKQYNHMFGGTLNWMPTGRFYVQLGMNYVLNTIRTPADDMTGAGAGAVLPSKNNYWTLDGTFGCALSQKTDFMTQYSYYRANDYANNSLTGLPLGAGAEDHIVSAQIAHQATRNLRYTVKYAFNHSRDQLFGGMHDFDAHVVSTGVQYRF
jgi:hypothetical protein